MSRRHFLLLSIWLASWLGYARIAQAGMEGTKVKDYYRILGAPENGSPRAIDAAFFRSVSELLDQNPGLSTLSQERRVLEALEAYVVLRGHRSSYDQWRLSEGKTLPSDIKFRLDPYQMLGLDQNSSELEIDLAFQEKIGSLVDLLESVRGAAEPEQQKTVQIIEAYLILRTLSTVPHQTTNDRKNEVLDVDALVKKLDELKEQTGFNEFQRNLAERDQRRRQTFARSKGSTDPLAMGLAALVTYMVAEQFKLPEKTMITTWLSSFVVVVAAYVVMPQIYIHYTAAELRQIGNWVRHPIRSTVLASIIVGTVAGTCAKYLLR